jgi:hypothetical protein
MDIVIANPIHTDMVQQTLMTTTHATMVVIREKTRSYVEWALDNDFILVDIETYGCFHFRFDSFLTTCAQTIIIHRQWSSLVLSMLVSY